MAQSERYFEQIQREMEVKKGEVGEEKKVFIVPSEEAHVIT